MNNRHFVLTGTKGRMAAFYNNEQEFLTLVQRSHHTCPGVLGARNGAAIAIMAAKACATGQVQSIEPYPMKSGIGYQP
jgi:hypothetical protein